MKRLSIVFIAIVLLFCNTSIALTNPQYLVYDTILIIDVSNSPQAEINQIEEATRNSENVCTIIYDSTLQEYTVNSTIFWNRNYSKKSFVDTVMSYLPSGIYTGVPGWKTFYYNFAPEWYETCTSYGLDPVFMLCLSCWQTGFGTSRLANECGNLFGLPDYRAFYDGDVGERAMKILKVACERFLAYTTQDSTVYDLCSKIAPEDDNFVNGITKLMNKIFGNLNTVTKVKVIGDFTKIECLPTYSSLQ